MYPWMYKPLCVLFFKGHVKCQNDQYPWTPLLCFVPLAVCTCWWWDIPMYVVLKFVTGCYFCHEKNLPPSVHLFMAVRYYICKKSLFLLLHLFLIWHLVVHAARNKIRNLRKWTLLLINPFPCVISENAY